MNIGKAARRSFRCAATRIYQFRTNRNTMRYTREAGHFVELYFLSVRLKEEPPPDPEALALLRHMQESIIAHGLSTAEEMAAIRTRYDIPSVT